PVVADRKVVQDGRCNAPIFGDPRQPVGGVLKLVNVGRRTRRITPTSAGRVVPLAERVIEISRQAVFRREDLVALDADNVLVEDRAATCQRRVVEQHTVEDRIRYWRQLENVRRDRIEPRLRNNVVREWIADHGPVEAARGTRVVNLAVEDW